MDPVEIGAELDRILGTFDELLALSRMQSKTIGDGEIELLNGLLERRSALIGSLNLQALECRFVRAGNGMDSGSLQRKRALAVEKLRELLRMDEDNRDALRVCLTQVGSRLAAMHNERQALHNYAYLEVPAEPLYIDRRR